MHPCCENDTVLQICRNYAAKTPLIDAVSVLLCNVFKYLDVSGPLESDYIIIF